jgi:hypothetical protein
VLEFRHVQEVEALSREQRQYEQRGLTYFHDEDGALVVKLRLTAESGALLLKALERALPEISLPVDPVAEYTSNASNGSSDYQESHTFPRERPRHRRSPCNDRPSRSPRDVPMRWSCSQNRSSRTVQPH